MSHRAALIASVVITLVVAVSLVVGQRQLFGAHGSDSSGDDVTPIATSPSGASERSDQVVIPGVRQPESTAFEREDFDASLSEEPTDEESEYRSGAGSSSREGDDDAHEVDDEEDEHEEEDEYEDD
jgi:hypothetical protein